VLAQAEAIFAAGGRAEGRSGCPAEADPYADPQYQVPDDLVW
jgi:uncharacterized protein YaiL (DUF2058 family)